MSKLLEKIIEHKLNEKRPKNRQQAEISALFQGKAYKETKMKVLSIENDVITLKRNRTVYKIKKVSRKPKRWDFIFFKEDNYKSPWFKENCGHLFLVKKTDSNSVYFDDLKGFDCFLNQKHIETYEVIGRRR